MASAATAAALPVLYGYWRRYALGLGTLIENYKMVAFHRKTVC
jgi:hypothetical protein